MNSGKVAPRFKKPGIKDPKLLVGIFIILLSVLGVVGLVRATNQTAPYYAVSKDIGIGEKISSENLTVVDVRLGDSSPVYIPAHQELEEGLVASRAISAGEILAESATTSEVKDGRRLVTLLLDQYAVSGFQAGDMVDIWVSAKEENSTRLGDPNVIAEGAEIHSVTAQESIIGGTGQAAVEIWVAHDVLPSVLGATNNGSVVNLVPFDYSRVG